MAGSGASCRSVQHSGGGGFGGLGVGVGSRSLGSQILSLIPLYSIQLWCRVEVGVFAGWLELCVPLCLYGPINASDIYV